MTIMRGDSATEGGPARAGRDRRPGESSVKAHPPRDGGGSYAFISVGDDGVG